MPTTLLPSALSAAEAMAAGHRPGHGLPQAAYTDPAIYAADLERVWRTSWLFAGTAVEIPPGSHLTWTVGTESVIVTRDDDGALHALHNTCRHRGCRLQDDGVAASRVLVCRYHRWTYGLDGSLRGAPHMGDALRPEARAGLALAPAHVREVGGLVYVCLGAEPPPFDAAAAAIGAHLGPHRPEHTQVLARHRYRVRANWKVLVENNRECYHCATNHPEFCLSNFDLGVAGDMRTNRRYEAVVAEQRVRWSAQGLATDDVSFPDGDFFRVARLPLKDGYLTESLSGQLVAPLLGELTGPDVGSVRVVSLPNAWVHVNADYVMATRLTPVDAGTTDIDVVFLVHRDAAVGVDVDTDAVTAVWLATSEQDWALCEANAAGIASSTYRPGPLSPVTEGSVAQFHRWYLDRVAPGAAPVE